jgi:hypothetical protein
MNSMFCGYILPLAGPIPQRWMVVGQPDLIVSLPGFLPAKPARYRSLAGSGPANMAANPPETGIMPTVTGAVFAV